jgi:hypothetical protein
VYLLEKFGSSVLPVYIAHANDPIAHAHKRKKQVYCIPFLIRAQNSSSSMADENKQNILQTLCLEKIMQSTAGNLPEYGMRQPCKLYLESPSLR